MTTHTGLNKPLLQPPANSTRRRDLELSCHLVSARDQDVELILFNKRKPNSVARRVIRLYNIESEVPHDQSDPIDTQKSSCGDCFTHPCGRQILSPRLRKVRDKGKEVIQGVVLPLLSRWNDKFRILFLVFSILLGLVSLGFAIATAVKNPSYILATVRIAVVLCTISLSLIHLAISTLKSYQKLDGNSDSENDDTMPRLSTVKDKLCSLSAWELYIILLKEALEYPVLMCNIVENAARQSFSTSPLHFTFFIFSALKLVYEVYFIRILVLISTIHLLRQLRQGKGFLDTSETMENGITQMDVIPIERQNTKRGLKLEVLFCCHIMLQIISQIFIVAAVWAKVQFENPNFDVDQEPHISSYSWILIASGFVLPILGTFMFFIPWSKDIQVYPIDFMIDLLSALKKSTITSVPQNAKENMKKIHKSIIAAKKQNQQSMRKAICTACTTPLLALLSIAYLVPFMTMFVGMTVGPFMEYNNITITCTANTDFLKYILPGYTTEIQQDVLPGINDLCIRINTAALIVTILSNIVIVVIGFLCLFAYIPITLLLLPFIPLLFTISLAAYGVTKCLCPQCKEWTAFTCLVKCFEYFHSYLEEHLLSNSFIQCISSPVNCCFV